MREADPTSATREEPGEGADPSTRPDPSQAATSMADGNIDELLGRLRAVVLAWLAVVSERSP